MTRIMPAGPCKGQVPVGEYEEDRTHEGRMQRIEITVTGHENRSFYFLPNCAILVDACIYLEGRTPRASSPHQM